MIKKALSHWKLKTKLNELVEGQNFISDKYDKMANDYKSLLTKSKKQKKKLISSTNAQMNCRKKVIAKNLNLTNSNNMTADKILIL